MAELGFLKSLLIILGLSGVTVYFLDRLRIPPVVGFLLTGVIIGPNGLGLIPDTAMVEVFAEAGVVLLLFSIGLEFSLGDVLRLRREIFVIGPLQVVFTVASVFLILNRLGLPGATSAVIGFMAAMSSTAIILRLLMERAELSTPHGRTAIGMLLFQDLSVVVFMLLIPVLSGGGSDASGLAGALVKSAAIIAIVIIAARRAVPWALSNVVRTRKRELFIISIIFLCLGAAYLTYMLGLSLAIGAFIAGIIISESPYAYQAVSDILPFRESLSGLFFISVGMLMDAGFLMSNFSVVLFSVAAIILLKAFLSFIAAFSAGTPLRVALQAGLLVSQIGEFSFVIAVAAMKAGLLTEHIYQVFLASSIITMLLTPLMAWAAPSFSRAVASTPMMKRFDSDSGLSEDIQEAGLPVDHVLIIGFGHNGRSLAYVLRELSVPYLVLELNPQTVSEMKAAGEPIYYGEGTSREILHKLGIEKARTIVITINDPSSTRRIIRLAREMNPKIYILTRTRFISDVKELIALGADEVVPEEFETSIEMFSRILGFYHMPRKLVEEYASKIREGHYDALINPSARKGLFHNTLALMPYAEYMGMEVEDDSPASGRCIGELGIRKASGATVVGIKRGEKVLMGPGPEFIFEQGDIAYLIGDDTALRIAMNLFLAEKNIPDDKQT